MVSIINILALLKVEESNLVLKIANRVTDHYAISRGEISRALKSFAKCCNFGEHFFFSHVSNLAKQETNCKLFFRFFYRPQIAQLYYGRAWCRSRQIAQLYYGRAWCRSRQIAQLYYGRAWCRSRQIAQLYYGRAWCRSRQIAKLYYGRAL